ncbi:MAG: signal peptidase II [Patescibacteria group bacterium]
MPGFPDKKLVQILAFAVPVLVADQVTKRVAIQYFPVACNSGGPFGLDFKPLVVSVLTLLLFGYLIGAESRKLRIFGYSLIIAGGVSNLLDRLIYGCVRDFISLTRVFPTFNLADFILTLGVLVVLYDALKSRTVTK